MNGTTYNSTGGVNVTINTTPAAKTIIPMTTMKWRHCNCPTSLGCSRWSTFDGIVGDPTVDVVTIAAMTKDRELLQWNTTNVYR